MGYIFDMNNGECSFSGELPPKALAILRELSENWDVSAEKAKEYGGAQGYYNHLLGVGSVNAGWCPWALNQAEDGLCLVEGIDECCHNYWFIDWLCWIMQGVLMPNGVTLNGKGSWSDWCEENANGMFSIVNNIVRVKGEFLGCDDWQETVKAHNLLVRSKRKTAAKSRSARSKSTASSKDETVVR